MSDFLLYWKDYWKDIAADPEAADLYWHTKAEWFFNKVRHGDRFWVVITAGQNHPTEWRLIQRIEVLTKPVNPAKHGQFEREVEPHARVPFEIDSQPDVA